MRSGPSRCRAWPNCPFVSHEIKILSRCGRARTALADGLYGVGEVTYSSNSLDPAHFDRALIANGATGLSSDDLGSGYHWRLQGGYRFNPNFAVEGGHIDFGKADYTASYSGGRAQGSLKAGGVDLAAVLLRPSTTVSPSSASWAAWLRRSTPV